MKKLALILLFALPMSVVLRAQKEIVIQKVVVGADGKADTIIQRIDPSEGGIPKIRFERGNADDLPPSEGRRQIIIEKNNGGREGAPILKGKKGDEREVNVAINDENGSQKGEILIKKIIVGPDGKADTIIERRSIGDGPRKMIFIEEDDQKMGDERGQIRIEKRVEKRIGPNGEMQIEVFENEGDDHHFGHRPRHSQSLFTNEIGLNATSLIAKLTRSGGETIGNGSPYALSHKLFYRNFGLRTAAGWVSSSNENAGTPGAGSAFTTLSDDRDFRVGLEYQFKVARRWRAFFGGDFLIGEGSRTIRTFFLDAFGNLSSSDIKKIQKRQGFGGAVGIQYMLNPKIGIGAETTAYWLRQKNSDIDEFAPNEPTPETANTTFSVAPPSAIFFYFRF